MKPRNILIASAVAVTMLAAGCSSGGSGSGTTRLKLEKTNITVAAFPAIDSAGLYVAQDEGLFAAQGLNVTIQQFPTNAPPPTTQVLIKDQVSGKYDVTAGDYVTYIENQLGADGAPRNDLRLVAEASFLQPNVLTVMVNGDSEISQVSQLKGKNVSVNAPNDIGTLLIDSLLVSHGLKPQQIHYTNVPFPGVVGALTAKNSPLAAAFAPEPFVSGGEAAGLQELADLDQGSSQDFPIQGYGDRGLGEEVPQHAEGLHHRPVAGPAARRHRPRRRGGGPPEVPGHPRGAGGVHLAARFPAGGGRDPAPAGSERDDQVQPAAEEQVRDHQHDRRLACPA
jgi:ABC-type nitrate/sulfonate/bicarbonate transport system substrate-binding protein